MIDINRVKDFLDKDLVIISEHAKERLEERKISETRLFNALKCGEIIEENETDEPHPSCVILNIDKIGPLHIVLSDTNEYYKIVTVYVPDKNKWYDNYKKRLII